MLHYLKDKQLRTLYKILFNKLQKSLRHFKLKNYSIKIKNQKSCVFAKFTKKSLLRKLELSLSLTI